MIDSHPFPDKDLLMNAIAHMREKDIKLVLAESCTGGALASSIATIAGSSSVFIAGITPYSNQAKLELLGVEPSMMIEHGAVSAEVVEAMATGALNRVSDANLAISISGISGPDGGSDEKPVGLTYLAMMRRHGRPKVWRYECGAQPRASIHRLVIEEALRAIIDFS